MTRRSFFASVLRLPATLRSEEDGRKISRAALASTIALVVLFAIIVPLFIMEKAAEKESESTRAKLRELAALATDYQSLKERVDAVEQKGSAARVSGIPQAMEDVSSSIGLKVKIKSVKAMGNKEVAGGAEESGEVQIEKVTMNELVNLLFRIEEAPVMLSIKRVAFKKSFENPELFNVTLTLSLFLKK